MDENEYTRCARINCNEEGNSCRVCRDSYRLGVSDAINLFLNSIHSYDTFGYDGKKLFRLETTGYEPYIHYADVIECANKCLENNIIK